MDDREQRLQRLALEGDPDAQRDLKRLQRRRERYFDQREMEVIDHALRRMTVEDHAHWVARLSSDPRAAYLDLMDFLDAEYARKVVQALECALKIELGQFAESTRRRGTPNAWQWLRDKMKVRRGGRS